MTQVWHTVDSRTGSTGLQISQFIGRHKKAAVTRLLKKKTSLRCIFPWETAARRLINSSQHWTQATVTLVALLANRSSNHWVTLMAFYNCYISTKYLTMWFRFRWLILRISQLTCLFHPNCHYRHQCSPRLLSRCFIYLKSNSGQMWFCTITNRRMTARPCWRARRSTAHRVL